MNTTTRSDPQVTIPMDDYVRQIAHEAGRAAAQEVLSEHLATTLPRYGPLPWLYDVSKTIAANGVLALTAWLLYAYAKLSH